MGTAAYPFSSSEAMRAAILRSIELGYRHFDTAALYQSEEPLGAAIADALRAGAIRSRDELFITSKLWCSDAHPHLVLPALRRTLRNLQLEYLDLYLVHWPVRTRPGKYELPPAKEDLLPIDTSAVWRAMEECHALGLTKSIGVSNFSSKKLETLLSIAEIPPVVNQVCAYSPLGAKGTHWGQNWVMDCGVLKDIAAAKGKTLAQVITICLRWVFEQGDCVLVKSFDEVRMVENLDILDWELSEEEKHKIGQIPQRKGFPGLDFVSDDGPYKSTAELWDGEI
ncbi:hypothetical protein GW17_00015671 [Ensete ventricosum]|nr:hypothetical protein GW17_00015671 [Ensete ventricosum]